MAYYGTKPIKVADGGTSSATLTSNAPILGNGTGAFSNAGTGTSGTILMSNGTTSSFVSTRNVTSSFFFSSSTAGFNTKVSVINSDNTNSSSNAVLNCASGGASGGVARTVFVITGGSNNYGIGCNNATTTPEVDDFVQCMGVAFGTNNLRIQKSGIITWPRNTCFLSYIATAQINNVTGNGGTYTLGTTGGGGAALTEIFDQHSDITTAGVFTAPATGVYDLRFCIEITGTNSSKVFTLSIVTSNRTYQYVLNDTSLSGSQSVNLDALCDMDLSDTATFTLVVTGEVSDTDDVVGGATIVTFAAGRKVA